MARQYGCASCGWKGRRKRDPVHCPRCGGITQRNMTTWDGLQTDLLKVAAFVLVVGTVMSIWVWLTYPFSDPDGNPHLVVGLRIDPAGIVDTPQGPVARFQLVNDSNHQFALIQLAATIYVYGNGESDPIVPALPEKTITIADLGPNASQVFEIPLEGRKSGNLFGWNAKLESYQLPSGYWNKRLESGLWVRLKGLNPTVPSPF